MSNIRENGDDETRIPTPPPMPFSQHPQALPDDGAQMHDAVTQLTTTHGIKVRDFAYENTLPPVTTVPRFSVQVQPRPRPLKRTHDMLDSVGHDDGEESDEEDPTVPRTFYIDSSGTGTSHTTRFRKKVGTLVRTLTEPAYNPPPPRPEDFNTRVHYYARPTYILRQPSPPRHPRQGNAALRPTTPNKAGPSSPRAQLSPISTHPQSQPSLVTESQESEPYVDTPLVTPNGSLQWPVKNTSALPNSQLELELPQLPDADAEVTMSQLGFTPERSQRTRPSADPSPSRPRRRRQPQPELPPSPERRPGSPSPAKRPRRTYASGSRARGVARAGAAASAPLQDAPAPRYDLRQRPPGDKDKAKAAPAPAPAPATATSRGTSRTRTAKQSASKSEKPSPRKKRKVTPPESPATTSTTRSTSRRRNGEAKANR